MEPLLQKEHKRKKSRPSGVSSDRIVALLAGADCPGPNYCVAPAD
jgi:hypothetical protein